MRKIIVEDIKLKNKSTSNELINQLYKSGGFTAKKIANGVNIIEQMVKEKNV